MTQGQLEVCLIRDLGRFHAIRDECTPGQVLLSEGDVESGYVKCWLHGSRFDLKTGAPPAHQPPFHIPAVRGLTLVYSPNQEGNPNQVRSPNHARRSRRHCRHSSDRQRLNLLSTDRHLDVVIIFPVEDLQQVRLRYRDTARSLTAASVHVQEDR